MAQRGSHVTGSVTEFDERRGIGEIAGDDGTGYLFHCTMIADGSRTIAVGTAVEFERIPGHRGRWEAASIVPATPGDK
jgi:cold shock CspA family protein